MLVAFFEGGLVDASGFRLSVNTVYRNEILPAVRKLGWCALSMLVVGNQGDTSITRPQTPKLIMKTYKASTQTNSLLTGLSPRCPRWPFASMPNASCRFAVTRKFLPSHLIGKHGVFSLIFTRNNNDDKLCDDVVGDDGDPGAPGRTSPLRNPPGPSAAAATAASCCTRDALACRRWRNARRRQLLLREGRDSGIKGYPQVYDNA